ncbi:MerR family transcriptional regulator [Stackebrandtia soli]|uniref:MerR family transcriptional regulator n=1 Tax=Stackebrandtia soli TaxID=1892856 RepID=UPI0039EBC3FE
MQELEVGEVAALTGLTVRTLHHYDRLGLVVPARDAVTGHRRYSSVDIERIYRVQALRRLGFPLKDMPPLLDGDAGEPLIDVVDGQLRHTHAELSSLRAHADRLSAVRAVLARDETPERADLLSLIASTTMLRPELRHDYANQANRYDSTRGASPSILDGLTRYLSGAPGPVLWDIGGGTGNYAVAMRDAGWDPTIVDVSADMREEAARKGLPVIAADATALPSVDGTVDAVVMVSMLHQVDDWRAALAETARVLRPGGRLAVMVLTADHLREVTWAYDLFPSMRRFAVDRRMSLAELSGALDGAEVVPLWFTDMEDASIAALCAHPTTILDERLRRQTSFFERMERDNPAELAGGLATLRRMLDRGESPLEERSEARSRLGDASLLTWTKPVDE